MRLIVIALLGGLFFAQTAASQSSDDPLDTRIFKNGWWVGGGASWSTIDADDISLDDDAYGLNVGVGYQFMNYFGVNARYRYLGEFSDTINPGTGNTDVEIDGWSSGLSAGYPITQRIAPVIGLGYYDFNFDANNGIDSNDSQGFYVSGGIATQIGRIVVQPNLIWYDVDDYDLATVELNFFWKFEAGN